MLLIYYNVNSFCVPDFQKMSTEDYIKKHITMLSKNQ